VSGGARHQRGSGGASPRISNLYPPGLMAVPKQRQSHSRTHKRRSQHKVTAPGLSYCPRCHEPRLPHRVCPNCGTYAGREVIEQQPDTADE
jgi:large subunit ribosomal protein L32